MIKFNNTQISLLRQCLVQFDIQLQFSGKTYFISANELLDFDKVVQDDSFTLTINEKISNVKINADVKCYIVSNGQRLNFTNGFISKLNSISTDRTAITISPKSFKKANLRTKNKYKLIGRTGGVLCGAAYGETRFNLPHLKCSAIPQLTQISATDNFSDVSIFKIKENITRYPDEHTQLVLWISSSNSKHELAGINDGNVMLYESVSVNRTDILYIYQTCDYTLANCQSRDTYKGDAYASREIIDGKDYHFYHGNEDWTDFKNDIRFHAEDQLDLKSIRRAILIEEDENAANIADNTSNLDNDITSNLAAILQDAQNYGSTVVSLAIAYTITVFTAGLGGYAASTAGVAAIQTAVNMLLNLPVFAKQLQMVVGTIGGIINSLIGDDSFYKHLGHFGFPNIDDPWFAHPWVPTLAVGIPRNRSFGKNLVMLQHKYKAFGDYRFWNKWKWEVPVGSSAFGDLNDIDVQIDIDFNYAVSSSILGGVNNNAKVVRIYNRYSPVGDVNDIGEIDPFHLQNNVNLPYSPIVQPANTTWVEQSLSRNTPSIISGFWENRMGGKSPGDNAKDTLSLLFGTTEWAHHIIPGDEHFKVNARVDVADLAYRQQTVDIPYIVLRDRVQNQTPKYLITSNYDQQYNNDDIDVEVAHMAVTAMQGAIYASVEAEAKIFTCQNIKVGILDFLARDNKMEKFFVGTLSIDDIPPVKATDTKLETVQYTSVVIGANYQLDAPDAKHEAFLSGKIIL